MEFSKILFYILEIVLVVHERESFIQQGQTLDTLSVTNGFPETHQTLDQDVRSSDFIVQTGITITVQLHGDEFPNFPKPTMKLQPKLTPNITSSQEPDLPAEIEERDLPAEIEEPDLPAEIEERDLPAEIEEPELPAEIVEPDLPAVIAQAALPTATQETALPTATQEPYLPTATQEPYLPTATQEPYLPAATQEPYLPTEIVEPDLLAMIEQADLPAVIEEPELPPGTEEPALPTAPQEPDLQTVTQEPDLQTATQEPYLPTATQEPARPTEIVEPDLLAMIAAQADLPAVIEEPELPPGTQEPYLPTAIQEPDLPTATEQEEFTAITGQGEFTAVTEQPGLLADTNINSLMLPGTEQPGTEQPGLLEQTNVNSSQTNNNIIPGDQSPQRIPHDFQHHINIEISAEKMNFFKLQNKQEKVPPQFSFNRTNSLTDTHNEFQHHIHIEISAEKMNFFKNKQTNNTKTLPTNIIQPPQPLFHIIITPSLFNEVFLNINGGQSYNIRSGGKVIASVLFPKVVILSAHNRNTGEIELEFFRTPAYGLDKWQIVVVKLSGDKEEGYQFGEGNKADNTNETREGQITMKNTTQNLLSIPAQNFTLSSMNRNHTSYPRITGQFNHLPRLYTIGDGVKKNLPLDVNSTYAIYVRGVILAETNVIYLQSGFTRWTNGTMFSLYVTSSETTWLDKIRSVLGTVLDFVMCKKYIILGVVVGLFSVVLVGRWVHRWRKRRANRYRTNINSKSLTEANPLLGDLDD